MSAPKVIREAKARLAALQAKRKEIIDAADAVEIGRKPFLERLDRLQARRQRVALVAHLAGDYVVTTLGGFNPQVDYVKDLEAKPKPVSAAIANGTIKVNGAAYGASYTAKGLAPRLRRIEKSSFRAYERAKAARLRADGKARAAKVAEDAALAAAFDAGEKFSLQAIVDDLAEVALVKLRLAAQPRSSDRWEAERMEGDYGAITIATQHLKFAQSGSSEPCPCRDCANERGAAEVRAKREAHIAELPTRLITCPTHGRKRAHTERLERIYPQSHGQPVPAEFAEWFDRWLYDMPVAYCPKGNHQILLISEKQAEIDKAAAKAAKVRPGKFLEGDQVTFTCPSCGSNESSEVYLDEIDGTPALRVGCSSCEFEPIVAGLAKIQKTPKAA